MSNMTIEEMELMVKLGDMVKERDSYIKELQFIISEQRRINKDAIDGMKSFLPTISSYTKLLHMLGLR